MIIIIVHIITQHENLHDLFCASDCLILGRLLQYKAVLIYDSTTSEQILCNKQSNKEVSLFAIKNYLRVTL